MHWLDLVGPHLLARRMRFLNIGANKGWAVNQFFLRFQPDWNVSNELWYSELRALKAWPTCGVCRACNESAKSVLVDRQRARGHEVHKESVDRRRDVRAVAVEMMPDNAQLLQTMFERLALPATVVHAAAGSTSGQHGFVPFSLGVGRESAILQLANAAGRGRMQRVKMVTVDEVAGPMLGSAVSTKIDFLSIDAEGYDAAVLQGARGVLDAGRVRLLEWEYHGVGDWTEPGASPAAVAMWLAARRYSCFWQSKSGALSPFVLGCDYAFRQWSNVICAHTSEQALLNVLHSLVIAPLVGVASMRGAA